MFFLLIKDAVLFFYGGGYLNRNLLWVGGVSDDIHNLMGNNKESSNSLSIPLRVLSPKLCSASI